MNKKGSPKCQGWEAGSGLRGGQRTGESGEAQRAATPGERRAQGRASVETMGDDGGSLGSPADLRPRGFHFFVPPMVHHLLFC